MPSLIFESLYTQSYIDHSVKNVSPKIEVDSKYIIVYMTNWWSPEIVGSDVVIAR